ncbi:TIGR03085 family metal-binding protein [Streptacidiphilus sp. ASG 303]|uniref:TIGR03085 family metal-binding protein n=1 Tax=Streptacidiphilus sp. ASG 303 TaxID=2896847 RepID=UPI001E4E8B00|nr:TIGR03085 family metal-binding protein [Streptacidiphilus sp. ASG 303]MCD0481585.1 TIGR03085 family metal-binding protein [Streptacidiphilus sp. ASG 303]
MSTYARGERRRLAGLLEEAGPQAPTLCEGWTATDLAAHLVVRERRPDAAPGIVFRPLADWTAKVQAGYAARPWPELVELVRSGPGRFSPFALPGVDEAANTVEFFVHAEDVRRAGPEWKPEPVDPGLAEALWKGLRVPARMEAGRRSPVGLVLRRPDGQTVVARKGAPVVTVVGEPAELLLFAFGRGARARVTAEGDPDVVALLGNALPLPHTEG